MSESRLFSNKIDPLNESKNDEMLNVVSLSRLVDFLLDESILNLAVEPHRDAVEILTFPKNSRFPNKEEINTILNEHKENTAECFKILQDRISLALQDYLQKLMYQLKEKKEINPVYQRLRQIPLRYTLSDPIIQERLLKLNDVIEQTLNDTLSHGPLSLAKVLIKDFNPALSRELLGLYLSGHARKDLDFDLVKMLFDNYRSPDEIFNDKTPLQWLFLMPLEEAKIETVKQIASFLIKNGASLEPSWENQTVRDLAKKQGYPKDVLQLLTPPAKKRSGCFIM